MAKVSDLPNDELVKVFIALRDRRVQRKKVYEMDNAADKAKQLKIEGVLLRKFKAEGSESTRTIYGTAFKKMQVSVSVGDKDVFLQHVKDNDAFELMDVRANATGVAQYRTEHNDLPPGVNLHEEIRIHVQRS